MQSGDGLADVARLVYVVAGPEADADRSGSRPPAFVVVLRHGLRFSLLCMYRASIHITARDPPPGATRDTGTRPRHIHSSLSQDFGTKREMEWKRNTPVHREVRHKGVFWGKGSEEEDGSSIVQSQIEFKRSIECGFVSVWESGIGESSF